MMSSYTQEVIPSYSLDESSFEFDFETHRNLFLDMVDTHFILKLQLLKGTLFDALMRENAENKSKTEDDSDEEPEPILTKKNL